MVKGKNEANASIIRNTYCVLSVCQLHAKIFLGVSFPNCYQHARREPLLIIHFFKMQKWRLRPSSLLRIEKQAGKAHI